MRLLSLEKVPDPTSSYSKPYIITPSSDSEPMSQRAIVVVRIFVLAAALKTIPYTLNPKPQILNPKTATGLPHVAVLSHKTKASDFDKPEVWKMKTLSPEPLHPTSNNNPISSSGGCRRCVLLGQDPNWDNNNHV